MTTCLSLGYVSYVHLAIERDRIELDGDERLVMQLVPSTKPACKFARGLNGGGVMQQAETTTQSKMNLEHYLLLEEKYQQTRERIEEIKHELGLPG